MDGRGVECGAGPVPIWKVRGFPGRIRCDACVWRSDVTWRALSGCGLCRETRAWMSGLPPKGLCRRGERERGRRPLFGGKEWEG